MGRGMPRPYNTCDSEQKYLPQREKLRKLMGRGMPRPYNICDSEQEVLAAVGEVTQTNGLRHAATVQHLQLLAEVLAAAEKVTQNQWVAACRDRTTPATHSRSTYRSGRSYAKLMGRGMPRPYNICDSEQKYLPQREKLRKTNGSRHAATVQHLQLLAEVLTATEEVTQNNGSRHAATVQPLLPPSLSISLHSHSLQTIQTTHL